MKPIQIEKKLSAIGYVLAGLLLIGSLLDTVGNSIALINTKVAIILTVTTTLIWMSTIILLKLCNFRIAEERIIKLSPKSHFFFVGLLIAFWLPTLFNNKVISKEDLSIHNTLPGPSFSSSRFSILILPFSSLNDCENKKISSFELALQQEINGIRGLEDIPIEAKVYSSGVCPSSYESAQSIGEALGADMVLWGNYEGICFADSVDACVRYVLVNNKIKSINKFGKNKYTETRIGGITEGIIQQDIEYIALFAIGLHYMNLKDYQGAFNYLSKILDKEKYQNPAPYIPASVALSKLKRYSEAIRVLEESISIKPTSSAYLNLAHICDNGDQNIKNCDSLYLSSIALDSNNCQAYQNFGYRNIKLGNINKADSLFRKALSISNSYGSHVGLGNIDFSKSHFQDAITNYRKAISINDADPRMIHNIGLAFYYMQEFDSAKVYLDKNLLVHPEFAGSHFVKAMVANDQCLNSDACSFYQEAICLEPDWKNAKRDSTFCGKIPIHTK